MQNYPSRGSDMPGNVQPPAFVLSAFINGPACLQVFRVPLGELTLDGRFLDLEFLPASALLWFAIGVALERRLRDRPLIKRNSLRLLLFVPACALCAVLLYADMRVVSFHGMLPFQKVFKAVFPRFGWWSPEMLGYPLALWFSVGVVCFGAKAVGTMRAVMASP